MTIDNYVEIEYLAFDFSHNTCIMGTKIAARMRLLKDIYLSLYRPEDQPEQEKQDSYQQGDSSHFRCILRQFIFFGLRSWPALDLEDPYIRCGYHCNKERCNR